MSDKKPNPYLRYAGMGFQMIAYTLVFVFLGVKLDDWTHTQKPYWTLAMSLLGVILSMVYFIMQFTKKKK